MALRRRYGSMADVDLVIAARAGDRRALDELLTRHYERIRAVCCRIAGDTRDGEDATQETLLRVVRSLDGFDARSSFGTWVYRIATNAALDELRRRQRRPISTAPTSVVTEATDTAPTLSNREDPRSSAEMERVEERMLVEAALAALSEDHRTVIVLRDVAGLDYAQIADTLGIAEGTVKSRIARARTELAAPIGNRARGLQRQKDIHG